VGRSRVERAARDRRWSESIAGGSESFVEQVKIEIGLKDNIARLPWRTGCKRFEKLSSPMAIISMGKMRF